MQNQAQRCLWRALLPVSKHYSTCSSVKKPNVVRISACWNLPSPIPSACCRSTKGINTLRLGRVQSANRKNSSQHPSLSMSGSKSGSCSDRVISSGSWYRYRPFFVWPPSRCEWNITTRAPPEAATATRELKNLGFMVLVWGLWAGTAAQAIWSGIQGCHEGLLCVLRELPELEIRAQSG